MSLNEGCLDRCWGLCAILDPIGIVVGVLAWILFFYLPVLVLLCVLFELRRETS